MKIKGGVTAPKDFIASAVASGVKGKRLDLALVYSKTKAVCAGFFTKNRVKAAPVLLCLSRAAKPFHKAVIINSGCANCLTGKRGLLDSVLVTNRLANLLGAKEEEVLMCSTGVIGKMLDVEKIILSLSLLVSGLSRNGSRKLAKAIMTTDTYPKELACSFKVKNKEVRIGGVAKGAGMIAPNMATTICIITTDADINKKALKTAAKNAVENSFNCITVDADTSTNDTFLCLANGASGVKIKPRTAAYKKFTEALQLVALTLAKMIVRDGEGATKFVQIEVEGAKTTEQAKRAAFGIANSNLVKTAIYGSDPNIGRIASACGAADAGIRQDRLDIYIGEKKVVRNGVAQPVEGIKDILKKTDIEIRCSLKLGKASHKVYTCDLSPEYIRINAEYS